MPDQQQDHDLLIALNTKMERLIADVSDMKNDTSARVAALESTKLDHSTFADFTAEHYEREKEREQRLKYVERFVYVVTGIGFAIEFYFKFIVHK